MSSILSLSATDSQLCICLFASFSDGQKCENERARITDLAAELGSENFSSLSRQILMGKLSLDQAVAALPEQNERMLAYEMARAVCEADGTISTDESNFLSELSGKLSLGTTETLSLNKEVDSFALAPVATEAPAIVPAENSSMILRYSILNGALELLPETLATMAIIPMQMKMVYRIGKSHGAELDRRSIVEFLATAGVGMGSQIVEGFARKIMKGFGQKMMGGMTGKIASAATGSAFSFASTYAIGHVAERYYAGSRSLPQAERKSLLSSFTTEGKTLHEKYLPEIRERASTLNPSAIAALVRGKQQP